MKNVIERKGEEKRKSRRSRDNLNKRGRRRRRQGKRKRKHVKERKRRKKQHREKRQPSGCKRKRSPTPVLTPSDSENESGARPGPSREQSRKGVCLPAEFRWPHGIILFRWQWIRYCLWEMSQDGCDDRHIFRIDCNVCDKWFHVFVSMGRITLVCD